MRVFYDLTYIDIMWENRNNREYLELNKEDKIDPWLYWDQPIEVSQYRWWNKYWIATVEIASWIAWTTTINHNSNRKPKSIEMICVMDLLNTWFSSHWHRDAKWWQSCIYNQNWWTVWFDEDNAWYKYISWSSSQAYKISNVKTQTLDITQAINWMANTWYTTSIYMILKF